MIRIFSVLILFISNSFADIQIRKQNDLFCYDGDTCYVIYEGKKIEFETEYNRDFFGRILSYIIVDGENVSKLMVSHSLGVVYDKNNKKDWCE